MYIIIFMSVSREWVKKGSEIPTVKGLTPFRMVRVGQAPFLSPGCWKEYICECCKSKLLTTVFRLGVTLISPRNGKQYLRYT